MHTRQQKYIRGLEEKNRLIKQKKLLSKTEQELENERREKGFDVYTAGANVKRVNEKLVRENESGFHNHTTMCCVANPYIRKKILRTFDSAPSPDIRNDNPEPRRGWGK
jgi:hypothetical protein